MRRITTFVVALLVLASALAAALAFESVYDVSIRQRPPDPLATIPVAATNRAPLGLRLVDSGGVGIPRGDWGHDYSHDRRVFRDVILQDPPYVDEAAFRRVEREWHSYIERMLEYGNNAVVVPLFLELINFDRASGSREAVYSGESVFRARHEAVRGHFAPLFEWTARRGMQVFLEADALSLTEPLAKYLRALSPTVGRVGIRTTDPAVWNVYRAGLEEVFDAIPSLTGLIVRFGEGGDLYNTEGWPYRSEMAVRDAASLRAMLQSLLPVFEHRDKTLVLRSWTVGVGQLGRLHVDPRTYEAVLGDIDSSALIVSTKFTAGDFFSYLPLNPTLAQGRHRRIVELQARPEFEGASAFPDFLGEEHARAMRHLRAANPRIIGTYVLSQYGGPLRAGPRALYPIHGFWLWTDANVFVASQLAVDPAADTTTLARRWATRMFGSDARVADAVVTTLIDTRDAVRKGFYIRPFAERVVRVPGLDVPPLMWIFEWDMVGGWHSLLSLVYHGTRDDVGAAINEGYAAVATVRRARQRLQAAVAGGSCTSLCGDAIKSLEYQEDLFDTLAVWRHAFLSYYRWLDSGDAAAWSQWRTARERFRSAAARHQARFGGDVDRPAFDLTSATRAVAAAERTGWARLSALLLCATLLGLLGVGYLADRGTPSRVRRALARAGRLMWAAALIRPIDRDSAPDSPSAALVAALILIVVGFLAESLAGFVAPGFGAGLILVSAVVALVYEGPQKAASGAYGRGRLAVAALGPLVPGAILALVLVAYAGPLGVWYWFWTSPGLQTGMVTLAIATGGWTACGLLAARPSDGWHRRVGGPLAAAGAGLMTLALLLPDGALALRYLDRPLNLAPATETIVFALQTYVGVALDPGGAWFWSGFLSFALGCALRLTSRPHVPRFRSSPPSLPGGALQGTG